MQAILSILVIEVNWVLKNINTRLGYLLQITTCAQFLSNDLNISIKYDAHNLWFDILILFNFSFITLFKCWALVCSLLLFYF